MYIAAIPIKTAGKKNRHEFTLIEPRKLSNIRNTNLHFFLLFSKNQNRFLKFQLRTILLLLFFFNNISIHAKVNQSISLRCLDCGFLISNWCTYVSKYKNPRRKVNRMWKFSLYSSFFLNLIISFLQFRGSWYLWVVLFSGFFSINMFTFWISWLSGNLRSRTSWWFSGIVISKW